MMKGFYSKKDLQGWKETEVKLLEDPKYLSDEEWRKRELAYATDCETLGWSSEEAS